MERSFLRWLDGLCCELVAGVGSVMERCLFWGWHWSQCESLTMDVPPGDAKGTEVFLDHGHHGRGSTDVGVAFRDIGDELLQVVGGEVQGVRQQAEVAGQVVD